MRVYACIYVQEILPTTSAERAAKRNILFVLTWKKKVSKPMNRKMDWGEQQNFFVLDGEEIKMSINDQNQQQSVNECFLLMKA